MHLVESFALSCGLEIDKPYIYESFIPLPIDAERYISFQPFSRKDFDAKNYDYWRDVIDILRPILNENKIHIIQIGGKDEERLSGCLHMNGNTSFGQAAYIIKNSTLHLGADSFGAHVASGYGKKMVILYSNMLPSQAGPYWSDPEDVALLSSVKKGELASHDRGEEPKTINSIKPEQIAEKICELLGLKLSYPFETVFVGTEYRIPRVESACESIVGNWKDFGLDSLIMRMDLNFDEEILMRQLNLCSCSIVTDREVSLDIVKAFKSKIVELVYVIDSKTNVQYLNLLKQTGVNLLLMNEDKEKDYNKLKLGFLDAGYIFHKERVSRKQALKKIETKNLNNLYYKNYCCLIRGEELKNSLAKDSKTILNHKLIPPLPVIDHPDFWRDIERFQILKKTS